jgi:hypothetical protein
MSDPSPSIRLGGAASKPQQEEEAEADENQRR